MGVIYQAILDFTFVRFHLIKLFVCFYVWSVIFHLKQALMLALRFAFISGLMKTRRLALLLSCIGSVSLDT